MAREDDEHVDYDKEGKLSEEEILELLGELPPPREETPLPVIEEGILSDEEINAILNSREVAGEDTAPQAAFENGGEVDAPEELAAGGVDFYDTGLPDFEADQDFDLDIDLNLEDFDDEGFDIYADMNVEENLEIPGDLTSDDLLSGDELEFVQDVSVYDTFDRDDPFESALKKAEKEALENAKNGKDVKKTIDSVEHAPIDGQDTPAAVEDPVKMGAVKRFFIETLKLDFNGVLAVILVVLLVVSIGAGAGVVRNIQLQMLPASETFADARVLGQAGTSTGNYNYIYVNGSLQQPTGEAIILNKFLVDSESTVVYVNKPVEWAEYDIHLEDDNGKTYEPDNRLYSDSFVSDNIRFNTLDRGIKGVLLELSHRETGEREEFIYRFEQGLSIPQAAYLKSGKVVDKNDVADVSIFSGTFSSSGTELVYAVTEYDANRHLDIGDIALYEGSRQILSIAGSHEKHRLDSGDKVIGRVEFGAVGNMAGDISVEFKDVFEVFTFEQTMNIAGLFADREESRIILPLDDNKAVLERFGRMGDYYVLVMHGEEAGGNTLETIPDVTLVLTEASGNRIHIPGKVKSAAIGTDVLFDISAYGEGTIAPVEFNLYIDTIKTRMAGMRTKINLSELPRTKDHAVTDFVEQGKTYLLEQGYENPQSVFSFKDSGVMYFKYRVLEGHFVKDIYLKGRQSGKTMMFGPWKQ